MLDLKDVAKHFDAVVARLGDRGGTLDLSKFKALFGERKRLYTEAREFLSLRAERLKWVKQGGGAEKAMVSVPSASGND